MFASDVGFYFDCDTDGGYDGEFDFDFDFGVGVDFAVGCDAEFINRSYYV